MKLLKIAVGVATSLLLASGASAEVQLSIQNGRVSLKAKDATLRQIMQEWARVGQTKIINVERIPGGVINPGQNPTAMPPGFQPPGYVPPQQGVGGVGQAPPQQPNAPSNTFGAPAGVARPGMVVPVPQQPGQQPGGRGRGGQ